MELKKQITSLEISKKLKELGVEQDAFWSWFDSTDYDDTPRLNTTDENLGVFNLPQQSFEAKYSAFSASELGELLPDHIEGKGWLRIWSSEKNGWHMGYAKILTEGGWITIESQADRNDTMPDAMGKMLIYLLENKLIKP